MTSETTTSERDMDTARAIETTKTIPNPLRTSVSGRSERFAMLGELHTAEVIRLPDAFVALLVQADHLYRSAA